MIIKILLHFKRKSKAGLNLKSQSEDTCDLKPDMIQYKDLNNFALLC